MTRVSQVAVTDCRGRRAGPVMISAVDGADVMIATSRLDLASKVGTLAGIDFNRVVRARIEDNVIDPGTAFLIHLNASPDSVVEGNVLDGADSAIVFEGACD